MLEREKKARPASNLLYNMITNTRVILVASVGFLVSSHETNCRGRIVSPDMFTFYRPD